MERWIKLFNDNECFCLSSHTKVNMTCMDNIAAKMGYREIERKRFKETNKETEIERDRD